MSTTPSNYIPLVNGTGTLVVHGEVVRISATNTFVRAQSPGALTGLVGVNGGGSIGAGGNANIFTSGAQVDVLLETGLTPVAGQTIYVSASVAGRATNVAPGTAVILGTIETAAQYAATGCVQVALAVDTGASGAMGPQGAQGFQGSAGAQGAQGAAGTGSQGSQGFQGAVGAQGLQGSQGSQGAQGNAGAQGSQGGFASLTASDPGITVANGSTANPSVGQLVGATWTVGICRVYALDGTASDANKGYADPATASAADYAVACAAAGAGAKATPAGLGAIVPRDGQGRTVEFVINTSSSYSTAQLENFLAGLVGYASITVRGTATVATAGCTAFDGSAADCTAVGCVTATGMNAAGYNPTGAPTTTSVQCLKVGGAGPAFSAEPAVPLLWRMRFDSATTTVALRNVCRAVAQVSGTDTLIPDTAWPAIPVAADIFYLEMAGVIFASGTLSAGASPAVPATATNPISLVGVRTTGTLTEDDGRFAHACCGCNALRTNFTGAWSSDSTYAHPVRGSISVGGGMRVETTTRFAVGIVSPNNFLSVTTNQLFPANFNLNGKATVCAQGLRLLPGSYSINILGFTTTTQNALRIIGPQSGEGGLCIFAGTLGLQLGNLAITNMGALPAIKCEGTGGQLRFSSIPSPNVTGSTGNTDVGMDLTLASGWEIEFSQGTLPTVTGTAGDVRLGDGTIVSWATAAAGIVDKNGNSIGSTGSYPLLTLPTTNGLAVAYRLQEKRGASVASGGTVTLGNDGNYFHITGTTAIDFITNTNWQDGAAIELYFESALTLDNNTGGPPGTAYSLKLAGGVNASMAAGSKIRFRRDNQQALWVEMFRGAA